MCVCLCGSDFFPITTCTTVFSNSHETWHTWSVCQYVHKLSGVYFKQIFIKTNIIEEIFEILILKFLANFFNFKFVLSLRNSSVGVIWVDKRLGCFHPIAGHQTRLAAFITWQPLSKLVAVTHSTVSLFTIYVQSGTETSGPPCSLWS